MRILLLGFCWVSCSIPLTAYGETKMAKITSKIESVNSMRESLVGGVQGGVSKETFEAVCKPVGLELKKFATAEGLKVRQVSNKYRNQNHKPNDLEKQVIKNMEDDKSLISLWKETEKGIHYFRRIDVKKACLNCHGNKHTRPDFIKKKYLKDRAFGFKDNDLRGIYSVFIKNTK